MEMLLDTCQYLRHFVRSHFFWNASYKHNPMKYHLIIHMRKVSSEFPCAHVTVGVTSQSEKKRSSFPSGNGCVINWTLLQWQLLPTVQPCSCVQQTRFGVALPVLSNVPPDGGPKTVRLANRLECFSAVSSRLCDTANSCKQQVVWHSSQPSVAGCVTQLTAVSSRLCDTAHSCQ